MIDIISYFGYYTLVVLMILNIPMLLLTIFANKRVEVITNGEHCGYFTKWYLHYYFLLIKMATGINCYKAVDKWVEEWPYDYNKKNQLDMIFQLRCTTIFFCLSVVFLAVWISTIVVSMMKPESGINSLTFPTKFATVLTETFGIWPLLFPVYIFFENYLTKFYQYYKKLDKAINTKGN